jgi:hypothetical protein
MGKAKAYAVEAAWLSAQLRAFWKRRSQGPGPSLAMGASFGNQGCCQPR